MPLIIEAHTEALNEMIANQQTESNQPNVVPASAPTTNSNQFDLLELADDEMFRDMNDNIAMIEVRGMRTEAGILFRAKHISTYLGMKRLLDILQDTRYSYKEGTHWIKLYQYSSGVVMDSSSRDPRDNKSVYDSAASSGLVLLQLIQISLIY